VFTAKNCATCHNDASSGAPKLAKGKDAYSDITMVAALWDHGPQMLESMKARKLAWPALHRAGNVGRRRVLKLPVTRRDIISIESSRENTWDPIDPLPSRGGALPIATRGADRYFELKSQIHRKLIGVLNLERASSIPKDRIRAEIGRVVERLLDEERVPMTTAEQTKSWRKCSTKSSVLAPLETLLKEPSISDILVNRYNKVFIERNGKLSETAVRFKDDAHLLHIIEKIVSQVGRRIDRGQPIVDARLADGSRVNAIIPPLALDGPCLSNPPLRPPRHHAGRDDPVQDHHARACCYSCPRAAVQVDRF
jgi:hypothetical protein